MIFRDPWKQDLTPEERASGTVLGNAVTQHVGALCHFPNPIIATLMQHVWNIYGSRTVRVAMADAVETPSFAVFPPKAGQDLLPVVMVPPSWLINPDPGMRLGAMVFCGSQAVDFFNGRLLGNSPECHRRAQANESEFLQTFMRDYPAWQPNPYQEKVRARFPDGIKGTDLQYEFRPTPTTSPAN